MKSFIRVICLSAAMVLVLGLFAGCSGDTSKTVSTASVSDTANGIFSTDDVKFLDENNESVYRIVRPDGDDGSGAKATVLFKQFKSTIGVNIKNVSDAEDGTDVYEILVGETNRPETAQAKAYLAENVGNRYGDYIICTIGKKIVIYSRSQDALQLACDCFVKDYLKAEGVKGGISYTHAMEGDFVNATVNGVSIGEFRFVRQRFNHSYLTQNQIEEANELFIEKTGFKLDIVEDTETETEYEIIVGDAEREGVTAVTARDEYSIKISGKKVYLNGGSPTAKAMAVSEFAKMVTAGSVTDANGKDGNYTETVAGYDTSKYYVPTWYEDFDYVEGHETGIDFSKWCFSTEGASAGHNDRNSKRAKTSDMLYVEDGRLNFYATYDDKSYYGFKIMTKNMMEFKYGILEMSAVLPYGEGFWIALWGCSHNENNPAAFGTEVNVVECFGNSVAESSNLHGWVNKYQQDYYESYWKPQGAGTHWSLDANYASQKKYYCPEGSFNNTWHTFTYVWTEDMCGFACDGNLYFSIDPNDKEIWKETLSQPIYIILSQATGFKQYAKCIADDDPAWTTTNNFWVDYVHVYQKNDGVHTLTYLK